VRGSGGRASHRHDVRSKSLRISHTKSNTKEEHIEAAVIAFDKLAEKPCTALSPQAIAFPRGLF
jgi:hypothetical protein